MHFFWYWRRCWYRCWQAGTKNSLDTEGITFAKKTTSRHLRKQKIGFFFNVCMKTGFAARDLTELVPIVNNCVAALIPFFNIVKYHWPFVVFAGIRQVFDVCVVFLTAEVCAFSRNHFITFLNFYLISAFLTVLKKFWNDKVNKCFC